MPIKQSTFFQKLVYIPYKKREIPFLVFFSFLLTFIYFRSVLYLFPDNYFFLNIKGVHIHHFSYGIFLLSIIGFYLLIRYPSSIVALRRVAIIYGIALAMAYDEFGMWLRLDDNYWIRQSYDAVGIIIMLFLNLVYFGDFWGRFGARIKRAVLSPIKKVLI